MTHKDKYRELCKHEKTIPIFSKDWWMDAVCGEDNWDVLIVEKGGEIVASMPIYIKRKCGLKYITQPKLTQTNGIHIRYPKNQKYEKRLSYEKELMNEIIDQIEQMGIAYYQQCFHYSVTNWLPFYWRGFEQTTRYTYVIEDLSDLDLVSSGFSKVVRKNIRKAEQMANVYTSNDIEKFYEMNTKTFQRQGLKPTYKLDFLKTLDKYCEKNNSRKILFAEDEKGNIHTSSYIVWDDKSIYQLMSGTDPKFRNSEFKTLLIWEALKFAHQTNKRFDFEGSMIEGIEEFFRKFGAVQKPYFAISKAFRYKPLFNIYKSLR
ncbi:MAG: GNAT family N-acetyltransferase [Clostridiales bacterium]|nr:GNAT family N-acetyltransferase [Clostridiales bacterium]